MRVGVPREIKVHEYRVGLVPAGVRELLERHEVLRRVVEYRDSLQALWNGTAANPARAVAQLREWCSRAEGSGIRALRDFAHGLPAYARG